MLTGVIIIVVAVPVNAMIFIALGKAFRNIMGRTDERMKLVNEMVGGIRIIKSYAWEIPFLKNLTESRNRELVFIKKHAYLFRYVVVPIRIVKLSLVWGLVLSFCNYLSYFKLLLLQRFTWLEGFLNLVLFLLHCSYSFCCSK